MNGYYIGVDLGTTAIKVVLFDSLGNTVREASKEVDLIHSSLGMIDQSPECWYEIPCMLIREVCRDMVSGSVKAIGISSQGISVVPVDETFNPLCNGISWLDTRADNELKDILSSVSEDELFRITGKHPSVLYSLPKIMWLKNNRPDSFERAEFLLMPLDYFTARACGNAVTDATMAGGTMLYDLSEKKWSGSLCDMFDIPEEKLPKVLPTSSFAGYMNAETQKLTGLCGKVIISVGAQDQKISAYGVGIEKETVTMSLGTAGALEILCDKKSDVLPSFIFDVGTGGYYILEGCINTFGAAIKWLRDNVCFGMSYSEMDALAEQAVPGSGGVRFYPHLSGLSTPHYGNELHSGWRDISLSSSRKELIRSVYEGLAFEIRMNLEAAERAGAHTEKLKLFGGGSKSDILCRIICDVCGITVEATGFTEMSSFGAAKSACVCCQRMSGDEKAADAFSGANSGEKRYIPSGDHYQELYRRYCDSQMF